MPDNALDDHINIMASLHQVITWAYVDPDQCRHMASLGLSELMQKDSLIWFIYHVSVVYHVIGWL